MLRETISDSKSERLTLSALPSILRNLSQLGRSGIVRFSFRDGFAYLELEEGSINRFLIPEDQFVDYLISRLISADIIKSNIAELLSSSQMNLKEFSLYLVREKVTSNAQVSGMFMKFARELLFSLFEQSKGSLDFNIRMDLISHIEPIAYALNVSTTPGQLFLDYWERKEKLGDLESFGEQFFSSNAELGTIFSPLEKNIMNLAGSGAYLQSLIDGVFEAKEEVVETLLRLTKSGILIAEELSPKVNETSLEEISLESQTEQVESTPRVNLKEQRNITILEQCLPLIVLALTAKFVIEYKAIVYFIENAFPS